MTRALLARYESHLGYVAVVLCLIVLFVLGNREPWQWHLAYDTRFNYAHIADYFQQQHNLSGLQNNERQPGEICLITALSFLRRFEKHGEAFMYGLMAVNALFVLLLAVLVQRTAGGRRLFWLSAILLALGPIVLYRLDLLVCLLLLSGLLLWQKNHTYAAMVALSLAATTKLFPFFVVPYFLILSSKKHGLKSAFLHAALFTVSAITLVGLFMLWADVSLDFIKSSLEFHKNKPIHVESLWGSLITLYQRIRSGHYPTGAAGWGIFGIDGDFLVGPMWFYDYFWLVLLSAYYLLLVLRTKRESEFNFAVVMSIIILSLSFLKTICPQYLLWFALLFPFLAQAKKQNRTQHVSIGSIILVIGVVTQYIYPIRYSNLLEVFYKTGGMPELFMTLFARNLLLLVLLCFTLSYSRKQTSERPGRKNYF